jgi:hypothetical protein
MGQQCIDLSTSERYYDFTWTAKISYNPDGAAMEVYERDNYDQSFFYDSILRIEYSIYDAGNALASQESTSDTSET